MTPETQVVGEVLAGLVKDEFAAKRDSSLMLKLLGFERGEIEVTMRALEPAAWPAGRAVILKIATHARWEGLPTSWFLAEDETQVKFRNRKDIDLVLFEVEAQPDAQSLRNMHLIQDGTVLDPALDGSGDARRRAVAELAWKAGRRGGAHPLPGDLFSVLEEIFHVVGKESGQLALRSWVEFVVKCSENLAHVDGAVSRDEVHRAVVSQLPYLRLFPDPGLFASGQVRKRLVRNLRLAGMSAPTGKDLEEEEIERRIEAAEFRGSDGQPLSAEEQRDIRERCVSLLQERRPERYGQVPFETWEQIFAKEKEAKDGLGTRIHKHIRASHADRLQEYEDAEVQTGLDDQDMTVAKLFLDLDAEEPTSPPLSDLLTKPLLKGVEKLANPRSPTVADPLIEILRQIYGLMSEADASIDSFELNANELAEDKGEYTLALFRFLYGRTVREFASDEDAPRDKGLRIDRRLSSGPVDFLRLHRQRFPEREPAPEDDEGEAAEVDEQEPIDVGWEDLRLQLVAQPGNRVLGRFTWSAADRRGPAGLVAFARLVYDETGTSRIEHGGDDLDTWCDQLRDPRVALVGDRPEGAPGTPVDAWKEVRAETFAEWRLDGIDAPSLSRYVDAWRGILERVLRECVPAQEEHPGLESFLEMDTLRLGTSKFVLLATHPLRLRWVAAYLDWMREHMRKLLAGGLRLNPEVDELFFDWLSEASPHGQPPIVCPGHQALSIATREYGWHEEYRPIVVGDAPSEKWVSAIDGESVRAMAGVVKRYLEAHPHKVDGLSILFISRDGDAEHVERLLKQVRSGEERDLVLTVHVVAPQPKHEEIARTLEDLGDEDRAQLDLLPRLRTILHPIEVIESASAANRLGLDDQIDLVMVPNLLGLRTSVHPRTQGPRQGRFDPLLDAPTHDTGGEDGAGRKNVARDFLPSRGDALLEGWSSLQVWRKTWSRTGTGDTDQVDYFSLQVLFTQSAQLFSTLHDWGHWVVTLDPYLTRDQIEASEKRPDIITVQPKVGKNGRYTLVVSSSTGRDFVVSRLRRRLLGDLECSEAEARELAERIYASSRNFAPGVVLRALGLGRTTQEILGIIVARRLVEEKRPRKDEDLFEAWLSLDELAHWFGGSHRPRADMLRVVGRRTDNRLALRLHIIEAKFREHESAGKGDAQLTRTRDVLIPAFTGDGEAEAYVDAPHWRRELVAAIEQCAGRAAEGGPSSGLWVKSRPAGGGLPLDVRSELVDGKYIVEDVEAILCTIGAADRDLPETEARSPGGHTWFRVGAAGFRRVIRGADRLQRPAPAEHMDAAAVTSVGSPDVIPVVAESPAAPAPDRTATPSPADVPSPLPDETEPSLVHGRDDRVQRGLGAVELAARYQLVLDTFGEFQIPVGRPEGFRPTEGPAFYEVRVVPASGVRTDRVLGQARELKLKLSLPEHLEIRGFVDRGSVVFQIPKEDHERYFIGTKTLWARCGHPEASSESLKTPIGEDASGDPVWLDFSDADSPHLLIGGTTGSGKSVALESILEGLCAAHPPERLRLLLVDPKGTELQGFEGRPHLEGGIGIDADDAIALLEREVGEMERRFRLFQEVKRERGVGVRKLQEYNRVVEDGALPWRLIVLDEYADLTSDKESRTKIEQTLRRIAQKGRAAGIHVIVATQKPSGEILSTAIRSNLPAQLALRVKTATDSRIVMDETGAETLAGKGDAFLKTQRGIVRVQTAAHEP